jgi:D-alanyl-D-alanine carboxypeptidase
VIYTEPARRTNHRTRIRWGRVAVLVVVSAALGGLLGHELPASTSSTATAPAHARRHAHRHLAGAPEGLPAPPAGQGAALGEADGAIPDGTTVFDSGVPGIGRLDPPLLGALRRAAVDAARDGVDFDVDSGWRSAAYQEQLFRDAVAKYGSEAEASRWVATPTTSAHVAGDAVDMASGAAGWLSAHGAAYGLCQIYGNEPWHFELRPEAVTQGCPAMYADPTHDPRMQR